MAAFVLGATLLATWTASVGFAGEQIIPVNNPPIMVAPVVVTPDNYLFYPNYGVYYNTSRNQYNFLKDNAWVSQPNPYGVSIKTLQASPSVKMDFHDSPSKHHKAMIAKYPHNWAPAGGHHDQK